MTTQILKFWPNQNYKKTSKLKFWQKNQKLKLWDEEKKIKLTKLKNTNCNNCYLKTKIATKLNLNYDKTKNSNCDNTANSHCDKTPNLTTLIATKVKNKSVDEIQKHKLW